MAYYIKHDSSASGPTPSTGWYNTDKADYPHDFSHADFVEVSEEEWKARKQKTHIHNRQMVEAPPHTGEALAIRQKALARDRYTAARDVVMRFYEEGEPLPPEWRDYLRALRSIRDGVAGPVPDAPPMPDFK